MSEEIEIQLNTKAVLNVPLNSYFNDFVFIVNGEEFKTNKFVSDLLSKKISHIHRADPTLSTYSFNTKSKGNFTNILNLVNFQNIKFSKEMKEEISYVTEVINILGIDDDCLSFHYPTIKEDNVISLLQDETYQAFQATQIEFVSQNFFNLCETKSEELSDLPIEIIYLITSHKSLKLINEDQLLKFINLVYKKSNEKNDETRLYSSTLYENVNFLNVSSESLEEFIEYFIIDDLDMEIWHNLCKCLITSKNTKNNNFNNNKNSTRYEKQLTKKFPAGSNNDFNGIIRYLKSTTNQPHDFNITASTSYSSNSVPSNVILYNDQNKFYQSEIESGSQGSWLCFDFIENRVILSSYQLISGSWGDHLRSWVIEGSNDNIDWEVIDSRNNCRGTGTSHIYEVHNPNSKEFRYIRLRQTGVNWFNSLFLVINSFEIYGELV